MFPRGTAREPTMDAGAVVIGLEVFQLAHQISDVPKEHAIEILAPQRADQALHEGMRNRRVRNGFDLSDLTHA